MIEIIVPTTVGSNMSPFKSLSFGILVVAILAVKCSRAENHININLLLSNTTQTNNFNDTLHALAGKFNVLATTVDKTMSSLLNRLDERESHVTQQLNATHVKLNDLVGRVDSFGTLDARQNDLEDKLNALMARVSTAVSVLVHLEGKNSNYAKYLELQLWQTNAKLDKLEEKVDKLASIAIPNISKNEAGPGDIAADMEMESSGDGEFVWF